MFETPILSKLHRDCAIFFFSEPIAVACQARSRSSGRYPTEKHQSYDLCRVIPEGQGQRRKVWGSFMGERRCTGGTKKNVQQYKYSITTSAACLRLHVLSCMCTSRMANRKKLNPSKRVQKSMQIRCSFRAVHGVDGACTSSKQEHMMISGPVHDSISSINLIDLLPINNDFFFILLHFLLLLNSKVNAEKYALPSCQL